MRYESLQRLCVALMVVSFAAAGFGVPAAKAQFGGLKDAARKAKDAMKKKDAEAQAQKDAEAKKEAEAKEAQAKKEAEVKKEAEAKDGAQAKKEPSSDAPAGAAAAPSFQVYSKFDFVPGEKIVAFEDFSQDAIGDFPAKWNTNGSGEIVTISGKPGRWLKLAANGFYTPEFITALPDDFTLELDILAPPTFKNGYPLQMVLAELPSPTGNSELLQWYGATNSFQFLADPEVGGEEGSVQVILRQASVSTPANSRSTKQFTKVANPVHVSLWRQRQRMRVYLNEEKLFDLPRALAPGSKLNTLLFALRNDAGESDFCISNLRLAVGAPDTRNKLLTQGKWVTHGILFDVNSDRVKPESYGALKEIVNVLTENADVKVQIVGHTDADGDDAKNLDLSKSRAASVRAVLAKEFTIAEDRMDTDGKGESQPVDKNDTPAGKANNRRVEFIKK